MTRAAAQHFVRQLFFARYEPSQSKPCGFDSSPERGSFFHLKVDANKAPPLGELAATNGSA